MLGSRSVLILNFHCLGLDLGLELHVQCMYKVYGTFIFVSGLDLGTSGLDPDTVTLNKHTLQVCTNTILIICMQYMYVIQSEI